MVKITIYYYTINVIIIIHIFYNYVFKYFGNVYINVFKNKIAAKSIKGNNKLLQLLHVIKHFYVSKINKNCICDSFFYCLLIHT